MVHTTGGANVNAHKRQPFYVLYLCNLFSYSPSSDIYLRSRGVVTVTESDFGPSLLLTTAAIA